MWTTYHGSRYDRQGLYVSKVSLDVVQVLAILLKHENDLSVEA